MDIFKKICESFSDLVAIHKKLTDEYWYLAHENKNAEIWKHRDDPSIGEYIIFHTLDGSFKVEYRNSVHPMFNRTLNSPQEFFDHIDEIMYEDIDIENGMKHLNDIAKRLRGEED